MARKQNKLNPPPDASFPLSSMIDVVFLLLIFFIVTQKPITEEVLINVSLPAPDKNPKAIPNPMIIKIDVDKDPNDTTDEVDRRLAGLKDQAARKKLLDEELLFFRFNDSPPMEFSKLRASLAAIANGDPNSTIIIRCDPNVRYRKLIRLLDLCSELGLNSLQLVDKNNATFVRNLAPGREQQ